MRRELTAEDLAARTGVPVTRLDEWRARGLVGSEVGFSLDDVERVRLVRLFRRCGISEDLIVDSVRQGFLHGAFNWYPDMLFPGAGRPAFTLDETADEMGLGRDLAQRLWRAVGKPGDILNAEDKEMLRMSKVLLDAGMPEEAQVQIVRVCADALGRVAETLSRALHFYVHEPTGRAGVTGPEVERAEGAARSVIEPFVRYFYRLGRTRALPHDILLHLFEEAGMLPAPDVRGQLLAAVAFVDLSSFTPLTEAMGDQKAAEVIERFAGVVRDRTNRWDGRVVKHIGDGFMLVFPEPSSAVQCVLDIEACATQEPQFPAVRSGVHWGAMLYRHGDYVGASVNIAARLTAAAQRHEVLVSDAVRRAVRDVPDIEFARYGQQQLKGVSEAVDVFAVRRIAEPSPKRAVDPVCGMELGPAEVAARLSFGGRDQVFCSEDCLRRFVAGPERYARA